MEHTIYLTFSEDETEQSYNLTPVLYKQILVKAEKA